MNDGRPRIVVIVASIDAPSTARESLTRFTQEVRGRGEVVLVDASRDARTVEIVRDLPGLRVISRPPGTLTPELWRDGWLATDAPLVAFSTAAMIPAPGWLDALLNRLSETGAAAVGGPIEAAESLPAIDRAVYLLRYANYFRPLSPTAEPPGDNAIYRRDALIGLESSMADGFWEAEIHRELRRRGERLAMAPDGQVTFRGGCRLATMLTQRFRHARQYGAGRALTMSPLARLARVLGAPLVPLVLLARIVARLRSHRRWLLSWQNAAPTFVMLSASWAVGEAIGTLLGASRISAVPPLGGRIERGSGAERHGYGSGRTPSSFPLVRRSVHSGTLGPDHGISERTRSRSSC